MQKYKCHKIISAAVILQVSLEQNELFCEGSCYHPIPDSVTREYKEKIQIGDYLVEYEDGYRSISPKKAFEDGYTLLEECELPVGIAPLGSFSWALMRLRDGAAVQRNGWNGKGIFIKLQIPDQNSKMTSPYIYIDTTQLLTENPTAPKSCVPWLASQTDMLSHDWEEVA